MAKKIGLLWDSISNNTGDRAIGIFLQRVFEAESIPYSVVNPLSPKLDEIAALVIGGGEIIRGPGHPFFDAFRVPGRHILNSVGVLSDQDTDYLREYRYVSVRSEKDRQLVGFGQVTPCVTYLYRDYMPLRDLPVTIPENAIGIQIHHGSVRNAWPLVKWLREHHVGPTVWLPVTHYNGDLRLMKSIARHVPNTTVLPQMEPDDVFRIIDSFRFFVSSSLHATLFAYAQGVPFIAWTGVEKIKAFLAERNLEQYGFRGKDELSEKLDYAINPWDGKSEFQARDREVSNRTLTSIIDHASDALDDPEERIMVQPSSREWFESRMKDYVERSQHAIWTNRIILPLQLTLHSMVKSLNPNE